MITAWQTIASRENNPIDPIVVTVGSIHGGTKYNIIPDDVHLQLTIRTYKEEVRQHILASLRGKDLTLLMSQSDMNHSRELIDVEFTIERGANLVPV